jgi:phospho-N-acetylmuramoyl-pentapeptide-transferase
MDAKIIDRSLKLSGNGLFWSLLVGLSVTALMFDGLAGRFLLGNSILTIVSWNQLQCLTLPLWISALASAGVGLWVVPLLQALKAGQIIREDGPQTHLKKAGTPTMGGIFFVPVAIVMALLWSGFSPAVMAVCALTLSYAAIGFLDDWQIIRRKSNKGISPRLKLVLQIGFASLFCLWLAWSQAPSITTIVLPFGWILPLGLVFWLLAGFTLVAESNAVNLTDGVDGLAGGTVAIALLGLGALAPSTTPDLMVFCACLSGGCLGFVAHNRNPARVFMGDTGSLALGGAIAAVGLLTQNLFVLLIVSGLFLVETLSVIAQVTYFKATKDENGVGKRLFKMSPFHNHLELSGWSEVKIVGTFYAIELGLILLAWWTH